MTFEMCVFLVIVGVIGVFVTVWRGLIADTSLDFLRKKPTGVLLEPLWGSPGTGKVYPAAQLGCDVCGIWTPGKTCSECVTWAEMQAVELWNQRLHVSHTHAPCDNEAEHRRLVKAAGW